MYAGFRYYALGAVAVVLGAWGMAPGSDGPHIDLLVLHGTVIDGAGAPARHVDIGVTADRVSFIGDAAAAHVVADRTIDAAGMIVAPGFIDAHTHADRDLASPDRARREKLNQLMQGVTTILVGNDGGGSADVAGRFEAMRRAGIGVNVGSFVGFGAIRRAVIGDGDRAPTPDELKRERSLVARGMCEGAVGFSTGLYYAPQSFAKTPEIVALAREAAQRGGVYESHIRSEGSENIGLLGAVGEAIDIGREAGLPVHIAHIKALGVDVRGEAPRVIAAIEKARASGMRVTADQYPWNASGTHVSAALVPRWVMAGGKAALKKRLADPALHGRIAAEMAEKLRGRGGAESLLVIGGAHVGKTLDAIAKTWRVDPVTAAIRIVRDEGDAPVASFNMGDADIEAFARQQWVVGSSDAVDGHPRKYGSFALRWTRFVRDKPVMTPVAFVHRSSGLTAQIFGLRDRGVLRRGAFADIVVFDPETYAAEADFTHPRRYARGVRTVIVNGKLAVDQGRPTHVLAGRPIAKPRNPAWGCPG